MTDEPSRILVVDDDAAIRDIVATRLWHSGYDVSIAANGRAALDRISSETFDVVVLDVLMPDIDGHHVLEELQDLSDPPSVIFLTARGELEDRVRGLYKGAVDYMTKPFEPDELAARVAVAARLRKTVSQARAESFTDSLTGLANRAGFELALGNEIARSTRYSQPFALIYLDVDRLKQTNDTYGHAAGDQLLRAVGRAVHAACRRTDSGARIGGDELAIILPQTDRPRAQRFVARLQKRVAAQRVRVGKLDSPPSCSIGMAIYPIDAEGGESLRQAADRDLYREKGRTKVVT